MRRIVTVLCLSLFLAGCSNHNATLDRAMTLRNKVISADSCSFVVTVTADYDEMINTFSMKCETRDDQELYFEVTKPDTISGITGTMSQSSGNLTFDEEVLAFELMIDGRLSPISAPWLMLDMLRGGYIVACADEAEGTHIQIEDTYAGEKILIDLYTDQQNIPTQADFIWNGKRSLSVTVSAFSLV